MADKTKEEKKITELKVKKEFADKEIGFNNSLAPLGARDDLHLLLEVALHHNVREYLNLFEAIPDEEELKEIKAAYVKAHSGKR